MGNWWGKASRRRARRQANGLNRAPRGTGRGRMLFFDRLEERLALSAVSWTGSGDGTSWSDKDNWSGHAVPTSADDVTINVASNPTIVVSAGQAARSLQLSDTLAINAGGTLAITATSQIAAAGKLTLGGGTLTVTGAVLTNLGTVAVTADSTINSSGAVGSLDNKGTVSHQAGVLHMTSGFTLKNEGTYNFTADGTSVASLAATSATLQNTSTGLVEKTGGSTTSSIGGGVLFNNQSGTVYAQSGTLALGAGTSTGGNYNADAGATIDLTSGATVTYSGMLSGSGAGSVQITGGTILLGGATTFNFYVAPLQYSGGTINLVGHTLSNFAAITISTFAPAITSANGATHNLGGTLDNLGTIIQSAGTLTLSDGVTLDNEAIYGFNGDASLAFGANNAPTITNEITGLFVKTAGVGASLVGAGLTFDNQGTVTVNTGTLSFPTTVLQVSGSTLTGGSWTAGGTGTLALPGGNFTINQGSVTLSGNGQFAQISTLAENDGSFSLLAGHSFATSGALTNNGRLVVGPGSTLTVAGTLSLGNASTVTTQIGGSPGSGLFGAIRGNGPATLHGTLNVQLANNFFPLPGQTFAIVTYPSAAGAFTTINGLTTGGNTIFTAAQNATNFVLTGVAIPAPQVTSVQVAGTSWSPTFLNYLQTHGQGNGSGYSIPVGSNAQLQALPWVNVNQVQIVFNEDVTVQQSSLTLAGAVVPNYAISNFIYSSATHTATWTLTTAINQDKLLIDVAASGPSAVVNVQNTALDGAWTNGSSNYPSGNGAPGGDFLFRFNVLPGDANQDGAVNGLDISLVASHWLQAGAGIGDVNGDGVVNGLDISAIASHWLSHFSTVPGDLNNDGVTNGLDISQVASHWLSRSPAGDANNDGVVNGLDLALIASNWLATGSAANASVSAAAVNTLAPPAGVTGLTASAVSAGASQTQQPRKDRTPFELTDPLWSAITRQLRPRSSG